MLCIFSFLLPTLTQAQMKDTEFGLHYRSFGPGTPGAIFNGGWLDIGGYLRIGYFETHLRVLEGIFLGSVGFIRPFFEKNVFRPHAGAQFTLWLPGFLMPMVGFTWGHTFILRFDAVTMLPIWTGKTLGLATLSLGMQF